ncbi:MAG TPA: histidine phosphatase family protein [Chloroflexi bacterium]|nr:histidine phosphatase family protein [Chloroflexota bacterium]
MTHIVLVRHGQTVWNKEARFRGQTDVPLDDFGLRQAEATGGYVASRWPVSAVYASPLRRTMQTAAAIATAQGLVPQPFDGLLDVNFGRWQGELSAQVARRYPEDFQRWLDAPHTVHFPDGETLDDVKARVTAGLDEIVARHPDETVALVSHTVANRVLLLAVIGLGNEHFWRLGQETCAVNVFDVLDDGGTVIQLLNDTSHLLSLSREK